MLIAFKLKLAIACVAGFATPLAVAPLVTDVATHGATEPAIVEIAAGGFTYRAAGDFTRAGQQAEVPLRNVRFAKPLAIMQQQVSSADYQLYVQEGACRALDRGVVVASDRPAVQVSWHDTQAYAGWLSRKTGKTWRLPSE
ncbi:SUMF1/EgtB/PvdO family nonheme iron enzyme [Bradyrhizobium sp. CB82]|uniref:formylglycine-generating enzyme family protein n=1 Tax=Bradyrhizobium sp. CB82 TaxID=3039159 RepID=UPI0024B176B0|nr:SUMF1/EgtB/PvdO family nonheme iron enzyme [Bradyrhizobium sp. CB82]WFU41965.1 SUMF1/EgtB/PvdO family nonheme iron enzyme [Bradyrhizobium sp. CB82]